MNLKCNNYTKNIIINGFIAAFFFSSFIYFEYFDLSNKLINTITILLAYFMFITMDKKSMFFTGFFIGLFWFYWISFSFVYYDLAYLIPIIILSIGFIYGILFYISAYFSNILLRIIMLIALNFLHPFGFNWLKLDLPIINTYFNIYKSEIPNNSLKIYMPKYNINQDEKWNSVNINNIVIKNIQNIKEAIKYNYDVVILPETVFPFDINSAKNIKDILQELSKEITIITGALSSKDGIYYNSTYMFEDTKITIANKVELVPFGERVTAPKIIRDFINKVFFNGAKDYEVAKNPTTFNIKGSKFRNAICYEATTDSIYQNLDTKYIIASSNNAWFTPSIEPTLQKLLLKYYAKKYNVLIYHSTNKSANMIIR